MRKGTIQILTIVMALIIAILLYLQVMYMKNIVSMRNDQFSEGVKRSLYAVTTDLEKEESRHFLEEDISLIESSILPQYGSYTVEINGDDGPTALQEDNEGGLSIGGEINTLSPKLSSSLSRDRHRTMQDVLKGQYIYQRGLLNEVILSILSQSSNRPITQRADSAMVAQLLHTELSNNGIDLPYEFAVVNRVGAPFYKSSGYVPTEASDRDVFSQALFPNDPNNSMNFIKVYFPNKRDYIFESLHFVAPSLIFILILFVIFIYTIIVAFRQKKLSEMKNDFINNMTHEFKTPISTISLASQMLNDNSVRKSPKMLEHISTVINDETKRLRFQVEKVLQMSMFDRQKTTLRLQDIDANVAIANIVHTFKIKVEKYGGTIEANLDANDSIVNVDEMHFTNVVFNLLDNAVKYRRDDVALNLVVATRNIAGDRIEISVADNGIGIRKEDLKKIFEKFYRVSTGNRHDVKGFGLGLAYVNKMVRELGGDIMVESEINVGTKFILTLPINKN